MENVDRKTASAVKIFVNSKWVVDRDVPIGVRLIGLLSLALGLFLALTFFFLFFRYLATEEWALMTQSAYHAILALVFLINLPFFLAARVVAWKIYIGSYLALVLYFAFDWPIVAWILFFIGTITAFYMLTDKGVRWFFKPQPVDRSDSDRFF